MMVKSRSLINLGYYCYWREWWNLKLGGKKNSTNWKWIGMSGASGCPQFGIGTSVNQSCCDLGFDVRVAEWFRKNSIRLKARDIL